MNKELIAEKNRLIQTKEHKRVRELQLNDILQLSLGNTDPTEIKGMLKLIKLTDNWGNEFNKLAKKNEEN